MKWRGIRFNLSASARGGVCSSATSSSSNFLSLLFCRCRDGVSFADSDGPVANKKMATTTSNRLHRHLITTITAFRWDASGGIKPHRVAPSQSSGTKLSLPNSTTATAPSRIPSAFSSSSSSSSSDFLGDEVLSSSSSLSLLLFSSLNLCTAAAFVSPRRWRGTMMMTTTTATWPTASFHRAFSTTATSRDNLTPPLSSSAASAAGGAVSPPKSEPPHPSSSPSRRRTHSTASGAAERLDYSAAGASSSSSSRAPPHTRPRRREAKQAPVYLNRWTAYFFRELDKGFASPVVLVVAGVVMSFAFYKILYRSLEPRRERLRQLTPRSRVPMTPSHEAMWGFTAAVPPDGEPTAPGESQYVELHRPGAAVFDPAVAVAESESLRHRPRLLYSEKRETGSGAVEAAAEEEMVVMELSEYDPRLRNDVYYRSLYYLRHGPSASAAAAKNASSGSSSWWPLSWLGGSEGGGATTTKQPQETSARSPPSPDDQYFRYMPGAGEEHIHAVVKCREVLSPDGGEWEEGTGAAVAALGASVCVPYAGDLSREVSRKLLLSLGPAYILQDPVQRVMPIRFTTVKQPAVRTLVVGLRGGELPRWLSSAYPNFTVDVVEPDAALIRVVKHFFGFHEHPKLQVVPMHPLAFVERKAAEVLTAHHANETMVQLRALFIPWKRGPTSHHTAGLGRNNNNSSSGPQTPPEADPRPYDLILMDGVDGAGRLPSYYGQLHFIQHVRQVLSPTGCVALAVPNRDAQFLYHLVQHWRLGFQGRALVLMHCHREPTTVLLTFQDEGGRGEGKMGTLRNADEMKDLIRTHLTHYGIERVPQFDLTREVDGGARKGHGVAHTANAGASGAADSSEGFFKVLEPGKSYTVQDFLPPGHPAAASHRHRHATASASSSWWWERWLKRWSSDAAASSRA